MKIVAKSHTTAATTTTASCGLLLRREKRSFASCDKIGDDEKEGWKVKIDRSPASQPACPRVVNLINLLFLLLPPGGAEVVGVLK